MNFCPKNADFGKLGSLLISSLSVLNQTEKNFTLNVLLSGLNVLLSGLIFLLSGLIFLLSGLIFLLT